MQKQFLILFFKAELRGKADDAPFDSEPYLRETWLARVAMGIGPQHFLPWDGSAPKQQMHPKMALRAKHYNG